MRGWRWWVRSRWHTFITWLKREHRAFEEDDPMWVLMTALAVSMRAVDEDWLLRTFNAAPATAELGSRSRLFIMGDWATGTDRAQRVANSIHKMLLEKESLERDCHVIHLGDTYFSGFWFEQVSNVLWYWPVRDGASATSWALPGNHDYYSGARGFFEGLLGDDRFQNQSGVEGRASIFDLSNSDWRVIGLDTSWVGHDLPPEEEQWLRETLRDAQAQNQKVILLSHHQPWSAFGDGPNPPLWKRLKALWGRITRRHGHKLWKKVQPLLAERPVEAWFWGHEHRLALYTPTHEIERPRLVGNGGVPTGITDASYVDRPEIVAFEYQAPLPNDSRWCRFAFAVVDLDPGSFTEAYFDELGEPIAIP